MDGDGDEDEDGDGGGYGKNSLINGFNKGGVSNCTVRLLQ